MRYMSESYSYKCPSCGAKVNYNNKIGKWKCDYCGNSYDNLFKTDAEELDSEITLYKDYYYKKKNSYLIKKEGVVLLSMVINSFFLIDITDNFAYNVCSLYEMNEIGKFIWDNISNNTALEIAKLLKGTITDDIPLDDLLNDVSEYLNTLEANGFISLR